MKRNRETRQLIADVRLILWRDWNPIGFPVPEDEYDSYVPAITRMLIDGVEQRRLADHLHSVERASIGMPGDAEKCRQVATRLLELPLRNARQT